eukprot:3442521-Rhodomonas_salina.1
MRASTWGWAGHTPAPCSGTITGSTFVSYTRVPAARPTWRSTCAAHHTAWSVSGLGSRGLVSMVTVQGLAVGLWSRGLGSRV